MILCFMYPSLLSIHDHQTANAHILADAGAAFMLPESRLPTDGLNLLLLGLEQGARDWQKMSRAARSRATPEAAAQVAQTIMELAKNK